jgi:hypothetical protein
MFSVEMKSKKFVKSISVSNDSRNRVYFEGFLGEIEELGFIEGEMLEIKGVNGTFRIDLNEEDLKKILLQKDEKKVE